MASDIHQTIHCETCTSRDKGVFCDLSHEHLMQVDKAKTSNHYKAHQILFYEGNMPYGLYCVSRGKVKIYKMDADGHQQIVRICGAGDILGYRSILANEPYSATAETIEPAAICFFDKNIFTHILETHPQTAVRVMKALANDLRHAEDEILHMVHKNVRERLAELLILFSRRYGEKGAKGVKLNITLTREEMAELVGCTQETVIRLLSDFKSEKLIDLKGRDFILYDMARLLDEANLQD